MKKLTLNNVLFGLIAWIALTPAEAQLVPDKPIRWLVPYAAGGASDMVAREGLNNSQTSAI